MNKYSDWTDAELNKEIALRRGYKIVDLNDNPHGAVVKGANWTLLNPTGTTLCHEFRKIDLFIGRLWAYNDSKALELLRECNGSLWFDHVCNLWEVLIEREDDSYIMTNCEQPARAICEAWLLWKDTQQEGAGS